MGDHLIEGGESALHHRTLGVHPEEEVEELGCDGVGAGVAVDEEVDNAMEEVEADSTVGDGVRGAHEPAFGKDLEDSKEGDIGVLEPWLTLGPAEEAEGKAGAASDGVERGEEEVAVGDEVFEGVRGGEVAGEGERVGVEDVGEEGVEGWGLGALGIDMGVRLGGEEEGEDLGGHRGGDGWSYGP